MKKYAFLFPGQGAQYVGMGKDFYEQEKAARDVFNMAEDYLQSSFLKTVFEGTQEELALTKNSQVAIYVMSFALLSVLFEKIPNCIPSFVAGLSLGEYTALAASKKISFIEGLEIVTKRGAFMQEACEVSKGSLRVVLGLEVEVAKQILLNTQEVWIANLNCPGQIVIAGTVEGLEKVTPELKLAGAKRVLPLDVSGAFHSPLMRSAQIELQPFLDKMHLIESSVQLVMNTVGEVVNESSQIRQNLINQVTHSVYWQKGIESLENIGIDCYLEIGCGKTLQGMNKKIGVKAETINLEKISDLKGVVDRIEEDFR